MQIRPAILSDHEFITHSQMALALETENIQLDQEITKNGVRAVLEDFNKGVYYVALHEVEGDLQPIACLLTIPEWSDWRNGTVLWIHSVYVTPSARKGGVYRAMYDYLKAKAFGDPKLRGLRLYVDKRNLVAQKTYQNLGMSNEHYDLYEWMK